MENILYIVTLCFAAAFMVNFIVAAIYTLLMSARLNKLKNAAIVNGYPAEKTSRLFMTPKRMRQQSKNFKEGYGYSMFSFEWILISNFGKDILTFTHDEKSNLMIADLKKIHRIWLRLLILGLAFTVLATLTLFSISFLPGMDLEGPSV